MGLRELIQTAIRLSKMKPIRILIVLLIVTNGIQYLGKLKSDSIKDAKVDKLEKDKDDCKEEKLAMQKYYSNIVDSVKAEAFNKALKVLTDWNTKLEESLKEQKEANKIQQTTLDNLRKSK